MHPAEEGQIAEESKLVTQTRRNWLTVVTTRHDSKLFASKEQTGSAACRRLIAAPRFVKQFP